VQRAVGAVQRLPAGHGVPGRPGASSHYRDRRRRRRPHHAAAALLLRRPGGRRRRRRRVSAVRRLAPAAAAVRLVSRPPRLASVAAVAGELPGPGPRSRRSSGRSSADAALLAAPAASVPRRRRVVVVVGRRRRRVHADDKAGMLRATQFTQFVLLQSHIDPLKKFSTPTV